MGLLENLKSAARHERLIPWPGKTDCKVMLKTNTEADYIDATKAAEDVFKGITVAAHNVEKYTSEFENQLLLRSIFDPETGKQLTTDARIFKELLTPEVKDALATELDNLHEEFAPNPDVISDERYKEIVAEIKKNARNTVENISSITLLKRLIITMANQ